MNCSEILYLNNFSGTIIVNYKFIHDELRIFVILSLQLLISDDYNMSSSKSVKAACSSARPVSRHKT